VDDLRCPLCTFRFGQFTSTVKMFSSFSMLRFYAGTTRRAEFRLRLPSCGCGAFSLAGRWPARQNGCGGNMANDKNKPERYSHEWNQALQRFVAAGQRLLVDNHDAAALAQLSESGTLLGWIVPIENK
jgi:hypothetical protein